MKHPNLDKPARRYFTRAARLLAAVGAMTCSVTAMAGSLGNITYGPLNGPAAAPTSIPTMGGIGLVLLSAFLLLVFWRMHRSGAIQGGARFMVLAVASGALVSGVGGVKLVSDAMAQPPGFMDMTSVTGGELGLAYTEDPLCVRNKTNVAQRIIDIVGSVQGEAVGVIGSDPEPQCVDEDAGGATPHPGCYVGQVLQTDDICGIGWMPAPT